MAHSPDLDSHDRTETIRRDNETKETVGGTRDSDYGAGRFSKATTAAAVWIATMADKSIPHFHNTRGVRVIEVGAKEFMCIGALPPFDHPHIFIDMGDDKEAVCGYCSTLYRYRGDLAGTACVPEDSLWNDRATVAAAG
ncbi:hypothetical protein CHELA20_51885 [Hyphomicrobiales bacterium]|nr:hypothetical protein CHELA41_23126 [Hyphomicrobiales bacterium]CAH1679192.1 hypothetical protein CHELA20_51885 [Hyphomicrobiales bacterium]